VFLWTIFKNGILHGSVSMPCSHPPALWDENAIQQYHQILAALEEASPSDDLSSFRVSDSELHYNLIGFSPGRGFRADTRTFLKGRYCEAQYMRRQIEGVALYFQNRQPVPEPRKVGFAAPETA
jgi:hypothetical protein